jgi:predicted transcriptional regulator
MYQQKEKGDSKMAVKDGMKRLTISMREETEIALDYMAQKLGLSRSGVLNLALFEFMKAKFPEFEPHEEFQERAKKILEK